MHHSGRTSGKPYVTPMMYLEGDGVIYVFAEYEEKTKGIRTIPVLALART